MNKTISVLWLLTATICLAIPVFFPSSAIPSNPFTDPISLSTIVMTAITFPAGLLSSPLVGVGELLFGIDPNNIGGQYLVLKLMLVLGLVQWFWIVPKLIGRHRARQGALSASDHAGELMAGEGWLPQPGDRHSPLEKMFDDADRS